MKIAMTGSTGFVGSRLLTELLESKVPLVLLARSEAAEKLNKRSDLHKDVQVVVSDLVNPLVLNDASEMAKLADVTDFFHTAASYDFKADHSTAYMTNVVGTQNILSLASQLNSLKRFHYFSTIAISGDYRGRFLESMFNVGQNFDNHYAQTKYRAEGSVGAWQNDRVQRIVYRLGVVVGDSQTGIISKFDGPYYFFNSLLKNEKVWKNLARLGTLPLPFDTEAKLPIIPVDVAARFFKAMLLNSKADSEVLKTYHVIGTQVPVRTLLEEGLKMAGIHAAVAPVPRFLIPKFLLPALGIPTELLDYMYSKVDYDQKAFNKDFPELKAPLFDEFSEALFRYMKETA